MGDKNLKHHAEQLLFIPDESPLEHVRDVLSTVTDWPTTIIIKKLAHAYLASEKLAEAAKVVISGHIEQRTNPGDVEGLYDALAEYEKVKGE